MNFKVQIEFTPSLEFTFSIHLSLDIMYLLYHRQGNDKEVTIKLQYDQDLYERFNSTCVRLNSTWRQGSGI